MKRSLFILVFLLILNLAGSKDSFANWSFDESEYRVSSYNAIPIYATIYSGEGVSDEIWGIGMGRFSVNSEEHKLFGIADGDYSRPGFTIHPGSSFLFGTVYTDDLSKVIGRTFNLGGTITWWDSDKHDGTYRLREEGRSFQFLVVDNVPPVVTPEPASMILFGVGGVAMAAYKRRKKAVV